MTTKQQFDLTLLNSFCSENKVELIGTYDKLNRESFITGKCLTCKTEFTKTFRNLLRSSAYCKSCTTERKINKTKKTNIEKYGSQHIFSVEEFKEKAKKTNREKRGVDYPTQSQEVQEKIKNTNLTKLGVEYPTQSKQVQEKSKITNLERLGVAFPSQSKKVKEKIEQKVFSKYGVKNVFQNEEIKKSITNTIQEKYNVPNVSQNQDIKQKKIQTCLENYGVENPMQTQQIKNKISNTIQEKYNVQNVSQSYEIKQKKIQTCLENYGVENPMHNPIVFQKNMKNRYRRKKFIFPSCKEVFVQGYEPFCLRDLLEQKQNEEDIITGLQEVPEVWYMDKENKKHRYYTDIYIKSENKCIEVKSTYTLKLDTEKILLKQQAVKDLGIECEIWVYSSKGELVEKIL